MDIQPMTFAQKEREKLFSPKTGEKSIFSIQKISCNSQRLNDRNSAIERGGNCYDKFDLTQP